MRGQCEDRRENRLEDRCVDSLEENTWTEARAMSDETHSQRNAQHPSHNSKTPSAKLQSPVLEKPFLEKHTIPKPLSTAKIHTELQPSLLEPNDEPFNLTPRCSKYPWTSWQSNHSPSKSSSRRRLSPSISSSSHSQSAPRSSIQLSFQTWTPPPPQDFHHSPQDPARSSCVVRIYRFPVLVHMRIMSTCASERVIGHFAQLQAATDLRVEHTLETSFHP